MCYVAQSLDKLTGLRNILISTDPYEIRQIEFQ